MLTALGTDEQIRNLQLERGFKNDVVKSKLTQLSLPKKRNSYTATSNLTSAIINPTKPVRSRIFSQLNQPVIDNSKQVNQKVDVGIQSDLKMDSKPSNPPQMMDTLNSFLKLLEASQKPACVENSTNTDPSISAQSRFVHHKNYNKDKKCLRFDVIASIWIVWNNFATIIYNMHPIVSDLDVTINTKNMQYKHRLITLFQEYV